MVRLVDWPADADIRCPGRWLAFRCTAETPSSENARRMFESVRGAFADGRPVVLRATDDERVGEFCLVTRVTIPDSSDDEEDSDGDGVADLEDDVPLNAAETVDSDDDGLGNHADQDDDNDGVDDSEDAFPLDPLESADTDGGGLGDNADADDDNDGVLDDDDAFPLDAGEWADVDGDGLGDNADPSTESFRLLEGVDRPTWLELVDDTFHVVDLYDRKVYAYSKAGAQRARADFDLDPANAQPAGIAFAGEFFLVADSEDNKVYMYDRTGVRRAERDFVLGGSPTGMVYAQGLVFVAEKTDSSAQTPTVRAYTMSGDRKPRADFPLEGLGLGSEARRITGLAFVDNPSGGVFYVMTSPRNGALFLGGAYPVGGEPFTFHVPRRDRRPYRGYPNGLAAEAGWLFVVERARPSGTIHAYGLPETPEETVEAHPGLDIKFAPGNATPTGIAYADGKFYVVDEAAERVFAYRADGSFDHGSTFDMHIPCPRRTRSTCEVWEVAGVTYANDRLFVALEFRHVRSGSSSYTQHVRAFTRSGAQDHAAGFDVTPAISHWMHGITFAEGAFYLIGNRRVFVHSVSGERLPEREFNFDVSHRGSSSGGIAFGHDTLWLYTSNDAFDGVRAYTLDGERHESLDLDAKGSGLTVAKNAIHVVDGGRVHAYSPRSGECHSPAQINGPLSSATVEMYQGPLVSSQRARDGCAIHYSPVVSGRDTAVSLRFDHPSPAAPDVRVSVGGHGIVAETSDTRHSGDGGWTTSNTYVIDGARFRPGASVSLETGRRITHDSDYIEGLQIPLRARTLAPLRVTFAPIRTPDHLAPSVDPASYMEAIRDFFPVGDYRATVGPVLNLKYSGAFTPRSAAQELSRRWYRDADADEFYHGIFTFSAGRCGYALTSNPVAVSAALDSSRFDPCPNIHAHEIGHNFGLDHADCGGTDNVDPRFPYPDAGIGPRRGWLLSVRRFIEPDSGYYDIMSYCRPNFVSDYHYDKAFAHLRRLGTPPLTRGAEKTRWRNAPRGPAPPLEGLAEPVGRAESGSRRGGSVVVTGIVEADGRFSEVRVGLSDKAPLAPGTDGAFTLSVLDDRRREIHTQPLAVHRGSDGRLSVWGARFAASGTPTFVIVRDAGGAIVLEEQLQAAHIPAMHP